MNGWVQLHPEVIYRCLFRVVWQTLKTFAADPKRLDGQLGMTAVLHTWGQNLSQHVHLHCLIPGGALSKTKEWHAASSTYLFPVLCRATTVAKWSAHYAKVLHQVSFRYTDYRNNRPGIMTLHCDEFIRRFLIHILPKGLMRIRHYGLLANRCRKASLAMLHKILASPTTDTAVDQMVESYAYPCPKCHKGQLKAIRIICPTGPRLVIKPG